MSGHNLFCNEGAQHVGRKSTRVSQSPGGTSSIVFGSSDPDPDRYQRSSQMGVKTSTYTTPAQRGAVGGRDQAPPPQRNAPPQRAAYHDDEDDYQQPPQRGYGQPQRDQYNDNYGGGRPNDNYGGGHGGGRGKGQPQGANNQQYSTLFCNEGAQLRNRPARKILQPPGGASSVFS